MNQYVFILGKNPRLSVAEIMAGLPQAKVVVQTATFLVVANSAIDSVELLRQLGGTIKIGQVLNDKIEAQPIVEELKKIKSTGKLNFGLSYYDCKKDRLGMVVKTQLKNLGISSRLVTSRDPALSSVVVSKNRCVEFLILQQARDDKKWLAKTLAVQEFEDYSKRDYGRPARDMVSGSMPPKLAKMMINLAQISHSSIILDPFCGSGTVLQEALLLGYKVIGSDISVKAIKDTKRNLGWLLSQNVIPAPNQVRGKLQRGIQNKQIPNQVGNDRVFQCDVKGLSKKVKSVDAIVTEPYLGPPLRGLETQEQIKKLVIELEELYLAAFAEFVKIVKSDGKVVIIFPWFKKYDLTLNILPAIKKLGFTQLNNEKLIYSRPDQKVWRLIYIFKK